MNRMKKFFPTFILLCALCACSSPDDDEDNGKDMSYPVINTTDIVAVPTDCQVFKRGDVIPLHFLFTDNMELGAYNIEIHNNFDHHTHGTSSVECPMDAKKQAVKPWIYNCDFQIPAGLKRYEARFDIAIPDTIDAGDYHFMVRLTDHAGWQQLHAVAIKITE